MTVGIQDNGKRSGASAVEQTVPLPVFQIPCQAANTFMTKALPCLAMRTGGDTRIQSICIICGLHIFTFTYLVKFICNLKISTLGIFQVIWALAQRGRKI